MAKPGTDQRSKVEIDLTAGIKSAQTALIEAADQWAADWRPDASGGIIQIPVTSGLRRGIVRGRVTLTEHSAARTVLNFGVEEEGIYLNVPAVGLLFLGAVGCVSVVLWPFFPRLLPLAPVGFLMAAATWLMVVSRLRNSGVEEFLTLVQSISETKG